GEWQGLLRVSRQAGEEASLAQSQDVLSAAGPGKDRDRGVVLALPLRHRAGSGTGGGGGHRDRAAGGGSWRHSGLRSCALYGWPAFLHRWDRGCNLYRARRAVKEKIWQPVQTAEAARRDGPEGRALLRTLCAGRRDTA